VFVIIVEREMIQKVVLLIVVYCMLVMVVLKLTNETRSPFAVTVFYIFCI
jgi:hypothetical protein